MNRTTELNALKKNEAGFTWGRVISIHQIGNYAVVEYHPWKTKDNEVLVGLVDDIKSFHCYVDDRDTSCSMDTLEGAIVECIAYKAEGANSRAAGYFMKMIKGCNPDS